jgi:sterol-4alpha-carboxylate 3-dehydrogenase (decarboxylating)
MFKKVNVDGTKCVIEACQKTDVKALVYTSSASVISDNESDLINADERWPVITGKAQTEYYSQTKAEAEVLVLTANRAAPNTRLLTSSIRPAGIYGEGDVQLIPPILNVYRTKRTGFQIGDNTNLFDFTYVVNVAHVHLLAACALLATYSSSTMPLDHDKVDGEIFFITNDTPVYFWDFARMVWKAAGSDLGTEHVWVLPQDFALGLGSVMEWVMWTVGKKPSLTRRQARYSCMTRYYDISKAKKRLGYEPLVGLQEGVERAVMWFQNEERREGESVSERLRATC